VVTGTPTPGNPLPTAPAPIFTSARKGNLFPIITISTFHWVTDEHTAELITDVKAKCHVEGRITNSALPDQPVIKSKNFSSNSVNWQ